MEFFFQLLLFLFSKNKHNDAHMQIIIKILRKMNPCSRISENIIKVGKYDKIKGKIGGKRI